MTSMEVGHCRHGEFFLEQGCSKCIGEERINKAIRKAEEAKGGTPTPADKHIIKVKYYSDTTGELSGREYTYFSVEPLKVGDILIVPVRDTTGKAQVSAIDVPEAEIAPFKDRVKTIPAGSGLPSKPETIFSLPSKGKPPAEIPNTDYNHDAGSNYESMRHYKVAPEPISEEARKILTGGRDEMIVDGTTAIINISPESDLVILSLVAEANRLRDYAVVRVITDDVGMTSAVDDLSIIAKVKKKLIAKKDDYLKPIKAHEDAVKAVFQTILTPIEDADRINRGKWTAYRDTVAKRAAEVEKLNRDAQDVARRQAELSGTGEFTVDTTPLTTPLPVTRIQTDMGSAGMRDNWTYEVIDFVALPNEYKVADTAMLNSIAKKYHDQKVIAGVRFYNKPILAVNTR